MSIYKLADRFEYKLRKFAQEKIPSTTSIAALDDWLSQNFTQSDKDKIGSEIYNSIEEEMIKDKSGKVAPKSFTLYINIHTKGGVLNIDSSVYGKNNTENAKIASDIVEKYLASKKFDAEKYKDQNANFIKYPA